nr:MAG TPA: hypothetical protein [Caudoviricetes sp.]
MMYLDIIIIFLASILVMFFSCVIYMIALHKQVKKRTEMANNLYKISQFQLKYYSLRKSDKLRNFPIINKVLTQSNKTMGAILANNDLYFEKVKIKKNQEPLDIDAFMKELQDVGLDSNIAQLLVERNKIIEIIAKYNHPILYIYQKVKKIVIASILDILIFICGIISKNSDKKRENLILEKEKIEDCPSQICIG